VIIQNAISSEAKFSTQRFSLPILQGLHRGMLCKQPMMAIDIFNSILAFAVFGFVQFCDNFRARCFGFAKMLSTFSVFLSHSIAVLDHATISQKSSLYSFNVIHWATGIVANTS
jgi:hypothetical protein